MKNQYSHKFISQILEIKSGGWYVLFRKTKTLIKLLCLPIFSFLSGPVVLLIVVLRPVVLIRFGILMSQRIGHFSADTEAYLCSLDRKNETKYFFDIIACPRPVCNRFLLTMWEKHINILPCSFIWEIIDDGCRFWTRGNKHHNTLFNRINDYHLISSSKPHLFFTDLQHKQGKALLLEMGIPESAAYICIHNREKAYLESFNSHNPNKVDYHRFRDFSVNTMVSAAENFTKQGYYVIRIGSLTNEAILTKNHKIIDYAFSGGKSEFLDIYILGNCSAIIGGDSGIMNVPLIFRKPEGMINLSPSFLHYYLVRNDSNFIFITKHLMDKKTNRLLGLREMFQRGLFGETTTKDFENAGVALINNSPEEIEDVANEVIEHCKFGWKTDIEDEKLQNKFWEITCSLYNTNSPWYSPGEIKLNEINTRIGASFLRKNTYLLD